MEIDKSNPNWKEERERLEEELEEIKQKFGLFDTNGDGKITSSELGISYRENKDKNNVNSFFPSNKPLITVTEGYGWVLLEDAKELLLAVTELVNFQLFW